MVVLIINWSYRLLVYNHEVSKIPSVINHQPAFFALHSTKVVLRSGHAVPALPTVMVVIMLD